MRRILVLSSYKQQWTIHIWLQLCRENVKAPIYRSIFIWYCIGNWKRRKSTKDFWRWFLSFILFANYWDTCQMSCATLESWVGRRQLLCKGAHCEKPTISFVTCYAAPWSAFCSQHLVPVPLVFFLQLETNTVTFTGTKESLMKPAYGGKTLVLSAQTQQC